VPLLPLEHKLKDPGPVIIPIARKSAKVTMRRPGERRIKVFTTKNTI
jgi:hypothetical protein